MIDFAGTSFIDVLLFRQRNFVACDTPGHEIEGESEKRESLIKKTWIFDVRGGNPPPPLVGFSTSFSFSFHKGVSLLATRLDTKLREKVKGERA